MRFKWRKTFLRVLIFVILLVFVRGLITQGHDLTRYIWPCQSTQEVFATQWLQTMKTFNSTMMNPNGLRELEETPTPLLSNENEISALDGLNISSSEEMRAARTLKFEPYNYILNEPNACLLKAPFLVILISVEPEKTDARDAIRKTWANESMARDLGFIRLFFIGTNNETQKKGSELQHTIEGESRQHHDIIQQDYRDTYNNLTLKTLMGMYWITKYCPEATYVMKTDSDVFVNTEHLVLKFLKPMGQLTQKYFTGHLMKGYYPNRNKRSKWYMPPEMYRGRRYPTFCSGTGYVLSSDMAQRIYVVSLSIPRLHLEDVYVGLCLAKLRIEPVPPPNDQLFNHWRVSYSSCRYSNLITSHGFHPNELIQYWQHLQSNKHNPC